MGAARSIQPGSCMIGHGHVEDSAKARTGALGFAEVIKHGAIQDLEFFACWSANIRTYFPIDKPQWVTVFANCCEIKGAIRDRDERESGIRSSYSEFWPNTIGHAMESVGEYVGLLQRREAISMGTGSAPRIFPQAGRFSGAEAECLALCSSQRLPPRARRQVRPRDRSKRYAPRQGRNGKLRIRSY